MNNKNRARLGAGLACMALVTAGVTSAQANLSGSSFEGNDGNLVVNTAGNKDWANVSGLHTGVDQPTGQTDNSFGQGTKEDNSAVTVVTGSIPPNKNDLTRFYEASELANNNIYLYLGWERLVNIGNANLDFEINQKPTPGFTGTATGPENLVRTAGDLLINYDFAGSGTPTLGINTWITSGPVNQCYAANALPCWGNHQTLGSSSAEGAVNTVPVTDPLPPAQSGQLGVGLFGEASIKLTAAGVFTPGVCKAFGSAFVKSRSSSSFTAELKDFIAPVAVNINNCGSITITKVTQNEPVPGTQSFDFTTSANLSSFSLKNAGSKVFSDLAAGTYSVTEAAQTAPWNFVSLTCDQTAGVTITGQQVSIALTTGENVTCTYTNHRTNSPTIATTLSSTSVPVGSKVHDSAALTGATANAGGTVTYSAYAGANTCTGTDLLASVKTVTNGIVPDSAEITLNTAGTYSFQAVYSGDANNSGATSDCTTEQLVVTKAQPTVATTQDLIPNDNFILSGGVGTPTGTITFKLYAPSDATCAGTAAFTQTVDVNGNATYSTTNTGAFHATTTGTWRWASSYSGDTNNQPATSACGVEQFTIVNTAP
jgi:hypothetical protein